jgi:Rad3-related DNA helicase
VVWQNDVAELNRQREDLDDVRERLAEEVDLIQAENEIKEKQAKAEEQNSLYDKIAREVKPQLDILASLLDKAEKGENVKENLSRVAVIGSYVKRRGNLLLLGNENENIPLRELENALRESGENLRLLGADIALTVKGEGSVPFAYALCAYDLYEQVVESTMDILSAMFIRLALKDEKLVLSLQLGVNGNAEDALAKLVACGDLSIEFEENDVYVDLVMGGDGR